MKVADLIDDLETGDRSMEHLKKSDNGLSEEQSSLLEAMRNISGGFIVGGLGQTTRGVNQGLEQHQAFMNQYANQQAQSQNAMNSLYGQGYVTNNAGIGGSPWNR